MFKMHLWRRRERVVAVVDIGSASAAVAILVIGPDGSASVIAAERVQLSIEQRTQDAAIAGIGESLKTAGENVQKKYAASKQKSNAAIDELFVIMHAPWSRSQTARATATFKDDVLITDRIISDLAKKALAEEHTIDGKNLLEASVIRVELNGYPSAKPVGKRVKEIAVYALLSDFTSDIRDLIETTLQRIFPTLSPVFRSATRAAVTVLRERTGPIKDYLLIDMESEGTTLTATRNGVTTEHELVPEGLHTILKRISESGMPEETLSLIRMLSRDQCSDPACGTMQASIARVEPELVRIFGEAMGKCASLHRLPDTLILIAHPDILSWLSVFFSRIDFAQFTLTTQPFVVKALDHAELIGSVQSLNGVVLDSGLALGCGLVHIEKN